MRVFFLFFFCVVLLVLLISIASCSRDERTLDAAVVEGFIVRELPINDIGINISGNTHVTTVWVYGSIRDGCQSLHETQHWIDWAEGSAINIRITMKESVTSHECTSEAVNLLIPVHIRSFFYTTTGKYKVIVNGVEKEFRVDL